MYKVKNSQIIFRTKEQASKLNELKALCGCDISNKKMVEKGYKLLKRFNYLVAHITENRIIEVVETAYKIADIANSETVKNAACEKGCSWCCRINIDITGAEAAFIEIKTKVKVKESKHKRPGINEHQSYCPFHDEEKAGCSIYEYRPLMCRCFFSLDNSDNCVDPSTGHYISTALNNNITAHLHRALKAICSNEENDIRHYFKTK